MEFLSDQKRFLFSINQRVWLSLLVNSLWIGNLDARDVPMPSFEKLSLEDGLSQVTVNQILQDKKGFLWFGTQDGLNRYDGYQFRIYRHEAGNPGTLSDNYIYSLFESRDGTLWVGLHNGLNRFDRAKERFTHYPQIAATAKRVGRGEIHAITEDHRGVLWLGTDGGLLNFDPKTETFKQFLGPTVEAETPNHHLVVSLHWDSKNTLWLCRQNGLIESFDPEGERFTSHKLRLQGTLQNQELFVWDAHLDQQDNFWIGTKTGLICFETSLGITQQFTHRPGDQKSLSHPIVRSFFEESNGNLWVGTEGGGLNRFDAATQQFESFVHEPANDESLSSNFIRSIFLDRSNVFWAGTWGSGLNRFDRSKQRFSRLPAIPSATEAKEDAYIRTIYQDRHQNFWIATGGGLDLYLAPRSEGSAIQGLDKNLARYHFRHDPEILGSMSNDSVRCILEDRHGNLWFGTNVGLNRLNAEHVPTGAEDVENARIRFSRFRNNPNDVNSLGDNFVLSLFEDDRGILWIGTAVGLASFDPERQVFHNYTHEPGNPYSLGLGAVNFIFQDQSGKMWIGSNGGGLNLWDQESERFIRFQHDPQDPKSLSHDRVASIYEAPNGAFWLGTIGGGLNRFRHQQFTSYRMKDGLPNDVIYAVLPDELGMLWLSTNRGLSQFDPHSETFRNFDVRDGLLSQEFNFGAAFKDGSGRLYFGGINGLNYFHPDEIRDDPTPPNLVITDLLLANQPILPREIQPNSPLEKSIEETDALALSHQAKVVTFRFAALHSARPEKNQYAYRLKGFESEWVKADASSRMATYTNLSPGKYVFQVKGSNRDGIWNEAGATLALTLTPPLWKTWWAYTFYFFLFAAILVSANQYFRRKLSQLRAEKKALEEAMAKLIATSEKREEALQQSQHRITEQAKQIRQKNERLKEWEALDHIKHPNHLNHSVAEETKGLLEETEQSFLGELQTTLRENIQDPRFGVMELAKEMGLSPRQFQRRIRELTGKKPVEIIRQFRLNQAAAALKEKKWSVAEIAQAVGFSSRRYFSEVFREHFGQAPREFLAKAQTEKEISD